MEETQAGVEELLGEVVEQLDTLNRGIAMLMKDLASSTNRVTDKLESLQIHLAEIRSSTKKMEER